MLDLYQPLLQFFKSKSHFPPAYLAAAADVQEQVRGRLLKLKADLRAAQSKLATVNTVRRGFVLTLLTNTRRCNGGGDGN